MADEPKGQEDRDKFKQTVVLLFGGALLAYIVIGLLLWLFLNWYINPQTTTHKKDLFQALGFIMTGLAGTFAGLAAIIGVYVTWRNLRQTREDTEKQLEVIREGQNQTNNNAQETLQLTEQGQITERFTRAIQQLGEADGGEPRMEIRLGGIYALERIAMDSPGTTVSPGSDYSTVMEVLTAYVRNNAPFPSKESSGPASVAKEAERGELKLQSGRSEKSLAARQEEPSADIQAILTVIGRRKYYYGNGELEPLDLRGTNLRGSSALGRRNATSDGAHLEKALLHGANLQRADLKGTHLEEAILRGAHLEKATLRGAHLKSASLYEANLEEAILHGAHLNKAMLDKANLERAILARANVQRAILQRANLKKADLRRADLQGAILQRANLEGANLWKAHLEGANLTEAHLEKANLHEANLEGADLRGAYLKGARKLTQVQLEQTIVDETTKLPEGVRFQQ